MCTIKLHGKALRSAKKLFGEQEIDPMAIIEYPYAVAWKIKIAEKSKTMLPGMCLVKFQELFGILLIKIKVNMER